ncbi:radical SAM-associated putative lipoprotein [Bacteroides sp. OttesenSCG-928-D19]|nr:radical SAM-associated putative lipoprotein [Bacteroides sp. OttesenSCG-928-D19]
MKKLNRKLIRGTNWALAGLISLLGFSACSDDFDSKPEPDEEEIINNGNNNNGNSHNGNDDGGAVCEYGTPYAIFTVSGKVTDAQGKGLEGIQVVVPSVDHLQRATSGFIPDQTVITHDVRDTLYSGKLGEFSYDYEGFPTNNGIDIKMKFEDISKNARFETDSVKVSFSDSEFQDGTGWYAGKTEKKITVALKNKKSE